MKRAFVALLVAALPGCVASKAVLPSLQGKPRIQINQQVNQQAPSQVAPAPVPSETNKE